ncbi:hypothetical protein ACFORG_13035 [Lutimaribacter marinistellae]|uniref:Lipoprotein n=1 Tax=Lutimaribacter marinistellae TaxID=1820329 RepID=A0ABV7TH97_9RHOB
MQKLLIAGAAALTLAACAGPQGPQATPEQIQAVSYRDAGPAYLTLYTMVNNRTGSGGHSALLINGSQRVIFDPAGSFYADVVPERNDVLYGITPAVEKAYRGAHARSTHHVVRQTIEVTPQQAEIALRSAQSIGATAGGFCANGTAQVLRRVPGFESISPVIQPTKLMAQFDAIPGVVTDKYYEDDDGDLQRGLEQNNAKLNQQG